MEQQILLRLGNVTYLLDVTPSNSLPYTGKYVQQFYIKYFGCIVCTYVSTTCNKVPLVGSALPYKQTQLSHFQLLLYP